MPGEFVVVSVDGYREQAACHVSRYASDERTCTSCGVGTFVMTAEYEKLSSIHEMVRIVSILSTNFENHTMNLS